VIALLQFVVAGLEPAFTGRNAKVVTVSKALKTVGNEVASTAVIDFQIAWLRQSAEIRC
jgi:hypothetical protein